MDSIFAGLLEFHPGLKDLARWPARSLVLDSARVLDPEEFIVADHAVQTFEHLCETWHDKATARETREAIHKLELEAAAQPPVINVTVAAPDGTPSTDGHFRVDTGPQTVTYVEGPAPAPDAGARPGSHHRPGRAIQATAKLAAQLRRSRPAEVARALTGRDGSQDATEVIRVNVG